jgi:hypothetical protein
MTPEDYLRRYTEPLQLLAGAVSPGDWQALLLEPDCYYPPHLELGIGLDSLNRVDLLEILRQILATEYPQQHLSRSTVRAFLEALQRWKDERAWRQTEMEKLATALTEYQIENDRIAAELIEYRSELQRHRGEAAVLRANLTDLRASTSWKVTKPLRWFGRIVKATRAPDA